MGRERRLSMDAQDWLEKIDREAAMILKQAKPCPDSTEGGCIGQHCIRCAAKEIQGAVRSLREQKS